MSVDFDRARTFAESLDPARTPGTLELDVVARRLAAALDEAGAAVTLGAHSARLELAPPSLTIGLGAIVAGLMLLLATRAAGFEVGPDPITLAVGFGGLGFLALVERRLRDGVWRDPIVACPMVEGRIGSVESAARRVIVATRIDLRPSRRSRRWGRVLAAFEAAWLLALLAPMLVLGGWEWLGLAGPHLMIVLGLLTLSRRLARRRPAPDGDNRTGLALLAELARAWPPSARDRLDARFVALGDAPIDTMVAAAPASVAWPTLLIVLDAPGLGREVAIGGPDRRRALAAARDLWLPARTGPRGTSEDRLMAITASERVILSGSDDRAPWEPSIWSATAQLVLELALRWGRAGTGDADPAPSPTTATPPRVVSDR